MYIMTKRLSGLALLSSAGLLLLGGCNLVLVWIHNVESRAHQHDGQRHHHGLCFFLRQNHLKIVRSRSFLRLLTTKWTMVDRSDAPQGR